MPRAEELGRLEQEVGVLIRRVRARDRRTRPHRAPGPAARVVPDADLPGDRGPAAFVGAVGAVRRRQGRDQPPGAAPVSTSGSSTVSRTPSTAARRWSRPAPTPCTGWRPIDRRPAAAGSTSGSASGPRPTCASSSPGSRATTPPRADAALLMVPDGLAAQGAAATAKTWRTVQRQPARRRCPAAAGRPSSGPLAITTSPAGSRTGRSRSCTPPSAGRGGTPARWRGVDHLDVVAGVARTGVAPAARRGRTTTSSRGPCAGRRR